MPYVSPGDGSVSEDRLLYLLSLKTEYDDLDFKADWDFSTPKHKMAAIKILAAMSSCPNGGYVILGVDDSAKIVGLPNDRNLKLFATADLGQAAETYCAVRLVTCFHKIEGKQLVLIYIEPAEMGLLVILKDATDSTFRKGDIFVRRNTSSIKITQSDYDHIVRRKVEELAVTRQGDSGGKSITESLNVLNKATSVFAKSELETADSLEAIKSIADTLVSTVEGSLEDFKKLISNLENWYLETYGKSHLPYLEAQKAFCFATLMQAVGSYTVRLEALEHTQSIIDVTVTIDGSEKYPSWIRHAEVMFSRVSGNDPVSLIGSAMGLIVKYSELRPDYPLITITEEIKVRLESSVLCFDFVSNLIYQEKRPGASFPGFMFYDPVKLRTAVRIVLKHYILFGFSSKDDAKQSIADLLESTNALVDSRMIHWRFEIRPVIEEFGLPKGMNRNKTRRY